MERRESFKRIENYLLHGYIESEVPSLNTCFQDRFPKSSDEIKTEELSVSNFSQEWILKSKEILYGHAFDNLDTISNGIEDGVTKENLKQFEINAGKNWHKFYMRNGDKFFKDRHYLTKVFPFLQESLDSGDPVAIIEIGCGVANAVIPLLELFPNCSATAVDFAPSAISIVKRHNLHDTKRFSAHVCDITVPDSITWKGHDFATMIFVLSAVAPEKMQQAIENVKRSLKPGGMVLFRDYAVSDMAQLRFSKSQRLGHNYYVRHDGTRSFFFSLEGVEFLFRNSGFQRVESYYIRRKVVNHRENKVMRRVFVNACYMLQ
eukprot:CAMPEP_0184009124 /NCGR_PEP_ID=MMETSP0954-20121128/2407_1 /TAXON_ID=627963 /ORGANISM="Aplanochytrium sp, Strain PBS07" /LENGTH=318 /DNA_ID=CAMNT_0026288415 /DNA_START=131 /DNA_END=1087 /DNA_ORIENTATION=-